MCGEWDNECILDKVIQKAFFDEATFSVDSSVMIDSQTYKNTKEEHLR